MRSFAQPINRASSVGAFLAVATVLSFMAGSAHADAPGPFQVTVKTGDARHGELPPWAAAFERKAVLFDATLRIVNRSDATRELCLWSCSWWDNWKLEGNGVDWARGPCTRNSRLIVSLTPGEAHEQKVVMLIKSDWSAERWPSGSDSPRASGGASLDP